MSPDRSKRTTNYRRDRKSLLAERAVYQGLSKQALRLEAVYIVLKLEFSDIFFMLFDLSILCVLMCFNVYVYIVYDLQFMITFEFNDVYTCALPRGIGG